MIELIALLIVLPFFFMASNGYGRTDSRSSRLNTEFIHKAVYLERLSRFIFWPKSSDLENSVTPFIIGIIGPDKMAGSLSQVYENQTIKGKKVEVRIISDLNKVDSCHILFILKSSRISLSRILEVVNGKPVLTVSDIKGGVNKGLHIGLLMRRQKLTFEVNQDSIKMSTLNYSWHLLKSAHNVVKHSRR